MCIPFTRYSALRQRRENGGSFHPGDLANEREYSEDVRPLLETPKKSIKETRELTKAHASSVTDACQLSRS